MTWEEAVSQLRELAKETEDFTTRIQNLASQIQRMSRDEVITDRCTCGHQRMYHIHALKCQALGCSCKVFEKELSNA